MSDRPRVAVIFTGGTISMRLDPAIGAAVPALGGAEILALTPGLDSIAEVEPIDWGRIPASHLSFAQILDIGRVAIGELARPEIDGVVVVQGTDAMEETAFAWDLLVDGEKPLVVVGAMRNADAPDYDGPANLRDAVRIAASSLGQDLGAVIVMNGDVLPADDATKVHTDKLDAFRALNAGPLGHVRDEAVEIAGRREPRRRLPSVPAAAVEPVFIVPASVGSDGALLRAAVGAGARGLVVAATGSGNTHPDMLVAAVEAMATGVPVAFTTRAASGGVSGSYGFPGGGATWIAAGAMPTGTLGAPKARVALALGLGAGLAGQELRSFLRG